MKKKLGKINQLLIQKFGVPFKASVLPDPLDLVIATILSQNTNDKNSYRAYQQLKEKFPNPESILAAGVKVLEDAIGVAGLTQQKAAAIKELLRYLKNEKGSVSLNYLNEYSDEDAIKELMNIKGIGVKTASCVLLFSLDRDVCPVDTHVHRVLNRIRIVETSSPAKTYEAIKSYIPEKFAHQLHTNLIRLGREICKSTVPACYVCPLKRICKYPSKDFSKKVKYTENNFFLLDNV